MAAKKNPYDYFDDLVAHVKTLGWDHPDDAIRDLYVKEELPIAKVSKYIGIGKFAIQKHLHRLGVKVRSRGGANNKGKYLPKLLSMETKDKIGVEIAKELGCTVEHVYTYCKKYGLPYKAGKPGRANFYRVLGDVPTDEHRCQI